MVQFLSALIYFLLLIMSVFLICLVLIQRGKGGGLAGAFGGVGGSSAFGTKAGDVFTRVTMISAGIWIALNMVLVILSNQRTSAWGDTPTPGSASKSAFTPSRQEPGDRQGPVRPDPTTPGGAANPFDALAPANPTPPPRRRSAPAGRRRSATPDAARRGQERHARPVRHRPRRRPRWPASPPVPPLQGRRATPSPDRVGTLGWISRPLRQGGTSCS